MGSRFIEGIGNPRLGMCKSAMALQNGRYIEVLCPLADSCFKTEILSGLNG